MAFLLASPHGLAQDVDTTEGDEAEENSFFDDDSADQEPKSETLDDESEDDDSDFDTEQQSTTANYTLELQAESQITFSQILTGESYMSVKYTTTIKENIDLTQKNALVRGQATIETEVTGLYAKSQFYTCSLDVEVEPSDIEIKSKTKSTLDPETDETKTQVTLQIHFDKSYHENWYSQCQGTDNSSLNTIAKDAPENYNLQILDLLEPTLKGLIIEEFNMNESVSFDLEMDSFESEDYDTGESLFYEGSASITLTPL